MTSLCKFVKNLDSLTTKQQLTMDTNYTQLDYSYEIKFVGAN